MDTWRQCEHTGDALIDVSDAANGSPYTLRVPWEHRHTDLGWGDHERATWTDTDGRARTGLILSEGPEGIMARDGEGRTHVLPTGSWERVRRAKGLAKAIASVSAMLDAALSRMLKAKHEHPPPPPGARWITVHPNGEGSKGVPVMIAPAGDGTHRIISGADGKLNHLRLRDVKSEDQLKEEARARAKRKREERAKLSPAERAALKAEEEDRRAKVRGAERKLVEHVRDTWGGIDDDLTDEDVDGLSEKAAEKMRANHHRRQVRQAMKARKDIASLLASERMEQIEDEIAVDRAIKEHPDTWTTAQELGRAELQLIEEEEEARRQVRTPRTHRGDAQGRAEAAGETAKLVLTSLEPEEIRTQLEQAGGRQPQGEPAQILGRSASEEQRRRATELMDDALILASAAEGADPDDDPDRATIEQYVIQRALERAGVDTNDPEAVKEALANEARIALERSELATVQAAKFEDLEHAGKGDRAMKALVHGDVVRGLTDEVRDATRKLGLRPDAKTPLKQAEIAELAELLGSYQELQRAKKGLDEVVDKAEGPRSPTYDKSRRAFDLRMGEPPEHVIEQVEEQVRRELATRILGLADTKASAHAQAVSDGHYASLADVSLAVADASYVGRDVMDAVGLGNAAVLMRHALEQAGHSPDDLEGALNDYHVREQTRITAEALAQADAFVPDIEATISDAASIEDGLAQLDAAEADLASAQRVIGTALGRMEGTATLAQAMRSKMPDQLTIELKDGSQGGVASHLTWLRSVGLAPDDYQIDTEAKKITIPKESWSKLINKESAQTIEDRKWVHDLKRGVYDEDGWMPGGMVSRSSTSFTDPPPDAPIYHKPLNLAADDIMTELTDHIGSRLMDGERPADIQADLMSPAVMGKASDPELFSQIAQQFFPLQTEEDRAQHEENDRIAARKDELADQYHAATEAGDAAEVKRLADEIAALPKPKKVAARRDVDFAAHYEQLTRSFLDRHHPDASSMHEASLYASGVADSDVREATLRALADSPAAVAAYTPIGELTTDHREALQDLFYRRAGIADTKGWGAEFDERVKSMVADLAGEGSTKVQGVDRGREAEAAGQSGFSFGAPPAPAGPGLFGGGAPPSSDLFGGAPPELPKREELTAETLPRLYPDQAKKLAHEYPREAHDLFMRAMGERPPEADMSTSRLPDGVADAAEHLISSGRRFDGPADLAKAAARHIGRQRAMEADGITERELNETNVLGELTPAAKRLRNKLDARAADLAVRGVNPQEVQRLFAARLYDAEVEQWNAYRSARATPWAQFVEAHGGLASAYGALQAELRGDFAERFAEHYGKVTGRALQTGIAEVPNAELHADALASPKTRTELTQQRVAKMNAMRGRGGKGEKSAEGKAVGGQFRGGSVLDKWRAARDEARGASQRQVGMFGGGGSFDADEPNMVLTEPKAKRAPKPGERRSLGARAEAEIQALMGGNIGKSIDPKGRVKLFPGASMDGRRVAQQRVIKQLEHGGRVGAWLGTGSGKTPTSIGAFTHLHTQGKATHGLFLVPTAVQSQFGEEMLSFTEPGKYRFDTASGSKAAASLLRDQSVHMRVLTHETATKAVLRLTADHHKVAPAAMMAKLRDMTDTERARTVREALDAHGIPRHMTYVDEAHRITTRQGAPESDMSVILGAMTHPTNATHALLGTATPHKNDTSEVYAMARLLDPDRYSDAYRFTQSYGVGSVAAPDAVRRELDHLTHTESITPEGVQRLDTPNPVVRDGKKVAGGHIPLSEQHAQEVQRVQHLYDRAVEAHKRGDVDVDAVRALSPGRFEAEPDKAKHEKIARELSPHLGIVRETAIRKALQLAPIEHNEKLRRMVETIEHDLRNGKPGIVFTDSAEEAHHVTKTLQQRGVAAGAYHGGLDERGRDAFRRQMADGSIKVGVMTAAGEAGINLQTAKVIHHYDVPKTAKSWSQRNGRAYRQGQKDDVDVHDWTHDHEQDLTSVRRLQEKGRLADVFQTPLGPLDEHGFARDYYARLNQKHASYDVAPSIAAK